jgi:hypothetical protein
MHRYVADPEWGVLLCRFREGAATKVDIEVINSRVVTPSTILPSGICYATYFNHDCDAIDAALFEKWCSDLFASNMAINDTIVILSDDLQVRNGENIFTSFKSPKSFWGKCAEDDSNFQEVLEEWIQCYDCITTVL